MDTSTVERIRANATFMTLERRRSAFSWTLTAIMLAVYVGFILLVAFAPGVMAIRLTPAISLGFPLGLGVILVAVALTGAYVVRANGEFDRLTREIVAGQAQSGQPGLPPVRLATASLVR